MDELVAAWPGLPVGREEPLHGALSGAIGAFIQEGGVKLRLEVHHPFTTLRN
jgi:hypothetical protein